MGDTAGWATGGGERKGQAFILRMEREEAAAELAELVEWVREVLEPNYLPALLRTTWCRCWWEHPTVVAYLHAVYLAWQELTGPEAGPLGPSRWHHQHLEPALQFVQSCEGMLTSCEAVGHGARHEPNRFQRSDEYDGPPQWLASPGV
jgi:hypothetical protein